MWFEYWIKKPGDKPLEWFGLSENPSEKVHLVLIKTSIDSG